MRDTTSSGPRRPTTTPHPLSEPQRRLVTLMRNVRFGRIENLPISNGEPVFNRMPTVVREIKFGSAENQPVDLPADSGQPKLQVVELLEHLRHLGNGVVEVLEVKHGLPFRMCVKEMIGA